MSSRSVNIIGGDSLQERQTVTVDSINNALVTIGEVHQNIHRGIFYSASAIDLAIAATSGVMDISVKVAAVAHIRARGTVSADFSAAFFTSTTLNSTPAGTILASYNRNGNSLNTSDMVIRLNPTIDADGVKTLELFIPGGSTGNATGGGTSTFEEWILRSGTYLIRLSNLTAQEQIASMAIDFYHPTQNSETE